MQRALGLLIASILVTAGCSSEGSPRDVSGPSAPRTPAASVSSPNVVLITSDDQTVGEMRWLPKTRRLLGTGGITFPNMIAPHPNCCPARAQILTGQYAHNNGVRTNSPPHGGHEAFTSDTALPVWLQNAGYATGFVGKYMHGYDGEDPVEPGWDRFRPIVGPPLSNYFGLVQYADGELTSLPQERYHTNVVAEDSADMIADFAQGDEPFFVWASYIAPHGTCATSEETDCSGPPQAEDKYRDLRIRGTLPSLSSPSFNERDLSDKPPKLRRMGDFVNAREQQRLYNARARALASLDDAVASTIRALRAAGELDDTVVLFTSDNGYMFGEHRQKGKVLAYEESVRVPLLMRGPAISAGERRQQTVAMIDIAPTISEISGADPLVTVDGTSFWGYATRDVEQTDRALLVQAGSGATDADRAWQFRGVRTNRFTYVRWRKPLFFEFYDRKTDPWQLSNLADSPGSEQRMQDMRRLLSKLDACAGRECSPRVPAQ